jgi:hypothetical protein
MKCWVTEIDLRPAYNRVIPQPPPGSGMTQDEYEDTDEHSELWINSFVRMAAENGTLTMKTFWGTASCPAEVEKPGVLFLTMREWMDIMQPVSWQHETHEITVTDDYFSNEWGRKNAVHYDYAYFDDPADAPQTWEEIEWVEEPAEDSAEGSPVD